MAVEPQFTRQARLNDALTAARGQATVPEGKGGHVFVDGTLHRILDISDLIKGSGAFAYSVNENELAHLCAHVDVTALGFNGLRTTTLAPLRQMKGLTGLGLWWVQKLSNLSPLADLCLDCLVLDDLRYANDITPLAQIKKLRALAISGGMNTTQQINTLEPLTHLRHLRELRLTAIKLGDDSLRPLAHCAALTDLSLPNTFPTEDYAYLRAKCPDLRCKDLVAYQSTGSISRSNEVMVTGRRKPFLNLKKDEKRLANYQQKFDALVAGLLSSGDNP